MTEKELETVKHDAWIAGFMNGAMTYADLVESRVKELNAWVAEREYAEYAAEQVDQENRNRG